LLEDLAGLKADAFHLGSVASELTTEIVKAARNATEIISLDTQGFVREFDRGGYARIERKLPKKILPLVDILEGSDIEIMAAIGPSDIWKAMKMAWRRGPRIILATRGIKGSLMFYEKSRYEIPSFRSRRIVDLTGAGDAFIGAFLSEYLRGNDVLWCAAVAAAASSLAIENLGPSFPASRKEVIERAKLVFDNIRRVG
jgi:sugar/nucleoside kinase (ribokinase family)